MHIRRGDYLDVHLPKLGNKGLQLPLTYYKQHIQKLITDKTLVFFTSDDIDYVKEKFDNNEHHYYSEENEIIDLIALTHADQMIMSNSSFSWWAAFLNKKKDKKIIAPKFYLGFKVDKEVPEGIMYDGFDWVNVGYESNY